MQNFSRISKGDDAMIEQHDAVKMSRGLVEIMGGNHDGHAFLFEAIQ